MLPRYVYPAANFHRRTNLNPVVVSKVSFTLPSRDSVPALRSAVEQFEEVLNRRNPEDVKYEWADINIEDLKVTMSIYWYDRDFFDDRHGAYLVGPHPFVFQRFGVTVNDLAVSHSVVPSSHTAYMTKGKNVTFKRADKTVLPDIISHLRGSAVRAGWVLNDLLNFPKTSDFRYSGGVGTNEFSYIHRSGHPSTRGHPTYVMDGVAEQLCEVIPRVLSGARWTIRESPWRLAGLVHERCPEARVFHQQQMKLHAGELTGVDTGEARRLDLADRNQLAAFNGIGNAPGLDRWIQQAIIVGVFRDGDLISMGSTIYALPEVSALVGIKTLPQFRGQGFGKQVTTKLAQLALERAATVTLTVRSDNDQARKLYESIGFRPGEERFWASLGNDGEP